MTTNIEEKNNKFISACKKLISEHGTECLNINLNDMFFQYLNSNEADDKDNRQSVIYTFQCLERFINSIQKIEK